MSLIAGTKTVVIGEKTDLIDRIVSYLKSVNGIIIDQIFTNIDPSELHKDKINLIVVNCQNDIPDCRELLFLLHSSDKTKELPVLVVLGDDESPREELLLLGAADYISKKDTKDELIEKINGLLGGSTNKEESNVIDITPNKRSIHKKGLKVFIVEDDPLLRNLLATKLATADFPCEFSIDGINVVEGIRAFKPDVIILDIMLPNKDGFEILADIKNDGGLSEIPVIIFTNRDEAIDKDRAKALGADCYMVKAMTELSELVEEIQRLAK